MTQFNKAQKKLDYAIKDPTSTEDKKKVLKKSLELATQAVMQAELLMLKRGKAFFGFYKTLLGEGPRTRWARIVESQIGVMPWTDLQGTVINAKREFSADSFGDCVKFHLLRVFSTDAAEHQK